MSNDKLAKVALIVGVLFSGVVMAVWSKWDAGAITGFLGGLGSLAVALWIQLTATAEVHTMVNQQRTDMQAYQRVLVNTLNAADVPVPRDQSVP